ncbi:MAG: hypothetical protein QM808_16070 [Steroidobacteraceae bacterium]
MSSKDSKPSERPPGQPKQSGRVAYDAKGNPVWEWETSTGVFDRDVSTQRLQKLEAKLTLEETQPVPVSKPKLALEEAERLPGGGMNPYDTGNAARGPAQVSHPALAHKAGHRPEGRKSLVSKYATQKKNEPAKPQSFWQKVTGRLKGDK